ncbi:hypothetical protein [Streptomyces rugosispiralis]|uniref:SH3 domain-containing protein n=1 Tax=Streptomyces rugosispiralis TaxID=2967341 RepID=A0ABT1V516_9ACTN|nr:hypothetical protein [Streptomyces rugosispiralis]MCQ8191879.1 hypothetical protein [Streptomyces rugosispiralis]
MRVRGRLTGAGLAIAAAAVVSGLGATAAGAQPADAIGTEAEAANVPVHMTTDAYIRSAPQTTGAVWGTVRFGEDWDAICFTEGGNASLNGRTSDIWVQLDQWGPSNGYVTEPALQNGHAGLPPC